MKVLVLLLVIGVAMAGKTGRRGLKVPAVPWYLDEAEVYGEALHASVGGFSWPAFPDPDTRFLDFGMIEGKLGDRTSIQGWQSLVDMYPIEIDDPREFMATSCGTHGDFGSDVALWLLTSTGTLFSFNDNMDPAESEAWGLSLGEGEGEGLESDYESDYDEGDNPVPRQMQEFNLGSCDMHDALISMGGAGFEPVRQLWNIGATGGEDQRHDHNSLYYLVVTPSMPVARDWLGTAAHHVGETEIGSRYTPVFKFDFTGTAYEDWLGEDWDGRQFQYQVLVSGVYFPRPEEQPIKRTWLDGNDLYWSLPPPAEVGGGGG
jgi:hypothetical protein